jgi:hypothetical protein
VLGPFAVRATQAEGDPIEIEATVAWESPSAGQASINLDAVEEAGEVSATADLPGLAAQDIPGTWFLLSQGDRTAAAPVGPASDPGGEDFFTEFGDSGVRAVSLSGDRGAVTVTRSSAVPPAELAQGVTWVAVYEITKAIPGAAIFVVPLRLPAPPLSLVRVLADHGQGFSEQAVMGLVTEDGLHATFAAEGSSTYALGVYVEEVSNWSASTAALPNGLRGPHTTEGIAASVQASLDEITSLTGFGEGLMAMLIQQTGASAEGGDPVGVQHDSQGSNRDSDADGVTNADEDDLGTDPDDPDTDGDGLDDWLETEVTGSDPNDPDSDNDGTEDGDEIAGGSDPNDTSSPPTGDTDGDGLSDGEENALGSDPNDEDSDDDGYSDTDEAMSGSDPNSANSTPTASGGFAPVPGCGGRFQTCFTRNCEKDLCPGNDVAGMYGMENTLLGETLTGFLGLSTDFGLSPEGLMSTAPGANQDQAGEVDAQHLISFVGVFGDSIFAFIPGGQEIQPVLGSSFARAEVSPAPTPTPTVAAVAPLLPLPPIVVLPPTATFTPAPPSDTSGPSIKSASDSPDPIKVTQPRGCTPTTSTVSAAISDPSGVASAYVLFFHTTIGQVPMSNAGGSTWTATLGPYSGIGDGSADYQIHAVDTLGNASDSSFGQITVLACIP